jgi:hypothetical protein
LSIREEFHNVRGIVMLSPLRIAVIMSVTLAACGSVRAEAQAVAPAGPGVTINKTVIQNGPIQTVKYAVSGGSPRLQALVRRVEWTENELGVVEQMQLLKLDTVVGERQLATYRTAQLANPYFPPGFSPLAVGVYNGSSETHLQSALGRQLAYEATPQAAMQLIGSLEQMQTDLNAELNLLPPQEKKAAQDAVDALRPRVAALSGPDVPAPSPPPVVSGQGPGFAPVDQQRMATTGPLTAPSGANAAVEVQWSGSWYPAEIMRVDGGASLIHYAGWNSSWDEWVPAARLPRIRSPPFRFDIESRDFLHLATTLGCE